MMFGETPTVNQRSPGPIAELDQDAGDGVGAALEDADLVVDELEVLDQILVLAEILAQRHVEGVDRAVALGRRDQHLVADPDLDDRLGDADELAERVVPALDADIEALDVEIARHLAEHALDEEVEGRVGALEGVALGLLAP